MNLKRFLLLIVCVAVIFLTIGKLFLDYTKQPNDPSAKRHYGWPEALKTSGDQWQAPLLAELLVDSYSVVRYVASRSLKSFDRTVESYDYVASQAEMAEHRNRVIKTWLDNRKPLTNGQLSPNLLIDPQTGSLIQASIDQLLRTQDRRDLYLPE